MLECDVNNLPLETMTQDFFVRQSSALAEYHSCLTSRDGMRLARECLSSVRRICAGSAEVSVNQACPALSLAAKSVRENSGLDSATKHIEAAAKSEGIAMTMEIRVLTKLFAQRERCLWNVTKDIKPCLGFAEDRCRGSRLRVLEINRMKMEDMDFVIQSFSDLHYVYYTRDPRGVSLSRSKTGTLKVMKNDTRAITEASYLCPRMLRDVVEFRQLQRKYPGLIHHVRYEDFVTNPVSKSVEIYGHLGETPSAQWTSFAERGIRNEPTNRWMSLIPAADLRKIDNLCGEVLDALGYPRYSSLRQHLN